MIVIDPVRSSRNLVEARLPVWIGGVVFVAYVFLSAVVEPIPYAEGTSEYTRELAGVVLQGVGFALIAAGVVLYQTHRRNVRETEAKLLAGLDAARYDTSILELPVSAVGRLLKSSWAPLVRLHFLPDDDDDGDPETRRDYLPEGRIVEVKASEHVRVWVADVPTEVLSEFASWLRNEEERFAAALVSAAIADRAKLEILERRTSALVGGAALKHV